MHEQFLADIVAHPEDDTPRLIYADWLEDHGQPERGEFIRVQCELAKQRERHSAECPCLTCKALRRRERELLPVILDTGCFADFGTIFPNGYVPALDPFPTEYNPTSSSVAHVQFKRGWPAVITWTLAAWVGERCRSCYGPRGEFGHSDLKPYSSCPACHGSGITGRHGPRLVRCCPLQRVALSDREPYRTIGGLYGWGLEDNEEDGPSALPEKLWRLLPGEKRAYPTRQAALDALSAAALAWARKEPV